MRCIDREQEMIFRPTSGEIRVAGPVELAKSGVGIHPKAVDRQWGEGAGDIYLQAMGYKPRESNGQPTIGGQSG